MKEAFKSIEVRIFLVFFLSATLLSLTERVNGSYGIITNKNLENSIILSTFLLSSFFYSIYLAQYDSDKIFKSHFLRGVFRGILFSIFPVIFIINNQNWNNLLLILFECTIFYIFFELFYNHYKKEYPFYVGEKAINDRIVRWINKKFNFMMNLFPLWYIAFKLILFIISFILLAIYWW